MAGTTVVVRVPEFRGGYWNVSCCNRRLYPKVVHKHEGDLSTKEGCTFDDIMADPRRVLNDDETSFSLSHVWEGAWSERVEECL